MAVIDSKKKEINFKIVYYGPARSGKTTSISILNKLLQSDKKSKVQKAALDTQHTLFFDFLALSSKEIGGYKTRFQVYTVPGQVLYDNSRKLLLKGVDGIIFVADSQLEKVQENLQSLEELTGHLQGMGYSPQELPMVMQFNKQDLNNLPPTDELRKAVNIYHIPDFETCAITGDGIVETFQECVKQVVMTLKDM